MRKRPHYIMYVILLHTFKLARNYVLHTTCILIHSRNFPTSCDMLAFPFSFKISHWKKSVIFKFRLFTAYVMFGGEQRAL